MSEILPQDANENSLWGASAIAAPRAEQLRTSLRADVLVVGAGYTGLSSALHLAEKGVSVVLLEASSIGFGGSGRNAGLVNAGIWKNPEDVIKRLGAAAAERFNVALRDTPALVFELVKRFDMPCQAQRSGTVHIAHSAGAMRYLEDRCRQLQELGAGVELIDGARSGAISGSPVYRHGGILDPDAGTIHPLSYARALATAAAAQGEHQLRARFSGQRAVDPIGRPALDGRVVQPQQPIARPQSSLCRGTSLMHAHDACDPAPHGDLHPDADTSLATRLIVELFEQLVRNDHSVRVPFIVAGPGVPKGEKRTAPIYLQDVIPTALGWAGAEVPDHVQFESILPHLTGTGTPRKSIYGAYTKAQRAVTMDGYKLIVYPKAKKGRLYHISEDPFEMVDLLEDGKGRNVAKNLLAELRRLGKEMGDDLTLEDAWIE